MPTKCPKCDFENHDTQKFCGDCGTQLSQDTPEVTKTIETPAQELTRGTVFADRYEIIEQLGIGGMGAVYRVEDKKVKEEIALKLIKPEISSDKKTIDRFRNELKLARKIRHENVSGMYDLGEAEGTHFITMEYISGEDLKSFIKRSKKLTVETAVSIAKQICDGLTAAHNLGVVHRDLKPSNIMIDKNGNARIMDFGIARLIEAKGITDRGVMIGTPEYFSPEQAETKEIDHRSDIYSLGVILYEMVTGQRPFEGETALSIARKHADEIPRDPREINPQIPDDLNIVIMKCLEKDKESRYQSAGEVRAELENIEKGIPTTDREIPKRKAITSKEITVTFGLKKLLVPALVFIGIVIIGIVIWQLLPEKTAVPSEPSKPSIAVLPFEDLSPNKDQEYFCDGMTEELINRLTNIQNLRIPARASAFSFKGKAIDIKEIGEKLNVEMVLNGSVRKAGNKLRITTELVKVADGYPIWSKIYERNIDDAFALQDEISLAIVDNLKIKLLGEEKTRLLTRHTQSPEAYNSYLKGQYFLNKRTAESIKISIKHFEKAIEEDPGYALAYAGLADAYLILGSWGFLTAKEAYPKTKNAAVKALEINDLLAEAHNALAYVKFIFDWDWQGADRAFKHAIDLNPNYASARLYYAEYLTKMGRFDEALREIKLAQEIDPLSLIINAFSGYPYLYGREYDKAIEQFQKTLEMDPDFRPAHVYLGMAYLYKGLYKEALAEFKTVDYIEGIGWVYAKMGEIPEVKQILEDLKIRNQSSSDSSTNTAILYSYLGDNDQSFIWLERAYEEHSYLMASLKVSPIFDSIRTDPRFTALLKKMNFE